MLSIILYNIEINIFTMNLSLLEDWLELMFFKKMEGHESIRVDDLSNALDISDADTNELVDELNKEGYLEIDKRTNNIQLTKTGEDAACRIARKHKILECFFTEMLGLSPERASEEACVIEHEITEETANRLSGYLHEKESCFRCIGRRGRKFVESGDNPNNDSNLISYGEGQTVKIIHMPRRGHYCRLMDLGILPGERVYIKRKLANNSLVITVKDCDIAVSPEIASKVFVEPVR